MSEENKNEELTEDMQTEEPVSEVPAEETVDQAPEEAAEQTAKDDAEQAAKDMPEEVLADAPQGSDDETPKAEQEESVQTETEKKGLFGKKKEKKDPKDVQIEELNDKLRRNMAEFDNYRKRTEKEKAAMFEMGAKDIIQRILPVIDNFERGLATVPEEEKGSSFVNGMAMTYKQMLKNLEEAGLKPIEAVGKPFDPSYHNAVMHIEDENLGENVVAQELQKGYMYKDSVVRHSMVQVAN